MGIRRSFNTNVRLWMVLGPSLFCLLLGVLLGYAAYRGYPRPGETLPTVLAASFAILGVFGIGRWWRMFREVQGSGGYRRRRRNRG